MKEKPMCPNCQSYRFHEDGYKASRAIRNLDGEYFKKLPIIAMSANAYDEDVMNCLEAGMNAHIAKPFNPDELLKTLNKFIRQ